MRNLFCAPGRMNPANIFLEFKIYHESPQKPLPSSTFHFPMSNFQTWCARQDLNLRLPAPQADALSS